MKKYLIRFVQIREEFRLDELKAICVLKKIPFPETDALSYSHEVDKRIPCGL